MNTLTELERVLSALYEIADHETGALPSDWTQWMSKRLNKQWHDINALIPQGLVKWVPQNELLPRPEHLSGAGLVACALAHEKTPRLGGAEEGSERAYADAVTRAYNRIKDRISRYLCSIREAATARGLVTSSLLDITGEEYAWSFDVWIAHTPSAKTVSVVLTVVESLASGDDLEGLNFELQITTWGDRKPYRYFPYNYTPQVWVFPTDDAAVDQRFNEMLTVCDPETVVAHITEALRQ